MNMMEQSKALKEASNQLNARIEAFQGYLQGLPFISHVGVWFEGPKTCGSLIQKMELQFSRGKDTWELVVYDDEGDRALRSSPMEVKAAAIRMFPKLHDEMDRKQAALLKDVQGSLEHFDTFISQVNLPPQLVPDFHDAPCPQLGEESYRKSDDERPERRDVPEALIRSSDPADNNTVHVEFRGDDK